MLFVALFVAWVPAWPPRHGWPADVTQPAFGIAIVSAGIALACRLSRT